MSGAGANYYQVGSEMVGNFLACDWFIETCSLLSLKLVGAIPSTLLLSSRGGCDNQIEIVEASSIVIDC